MNISANAIVVCTIEHTVTATGRDWHDNLRRRAECTPVQRQSGHSAGIHHLHGNRGRCRHRLHALPGERHHTIDPIVDDVIQNEHIVIAMTLTNTGTTALTPVTLRDDRASEFVRNT